jgi:hypothetical protein
MAILYAVTAAGAVYRYDTSTAKSTLQFQCLERRSQPVRGLAYAAQEENDPPLGGAKANGERGVVFLLKNVDDATASILAYTPSGHRLYEYPFPAAVTFQGLELWPGRLPNGQVRLVATAGSDVYFLDLSFGAVNLAIASTDLSFGLGLTVATDGLDKNAEYASVDYYMASGDSRPVLMKVALNADSVFAARASGAAGTFSTRVHPALVGLANADGTIYTGEVVNFQTELHTVSGGSALTTGAQKQQAGKIPGAMVDLSANIPLQGVLTAPSLPISIAVTTRQYDLSSGSLLGPVNVLYLGNAAVGGQTTPKVVDLRVDGVRSISSVKLGVVAADVKGHAVSGIFLAGHQNIVDPDFVPTQFFSGLNEEGLSSSVHNFAVGLKGGPSSESLESDYVYLAAQVPGQFLESGRCEYRWFFDYEDL